MPEHKVEITYPPEEGREDRVEVIPFEDELLARAFAAHKAAMSNVESARYIEPEKPLTVVTAKEDRYAPPHRRTRLLSRIHRQRNA